jgi:branched-chain amino acid transport system substrate-binding protein
VGLSKGTASAVVDQGGKSWFFLTADYAFGHQMEADATTIVKAKGGTVVGGVKVPINASDFSSFLVQAQNSGAQILALANAGGDTVNSIKAAKEFGVSKKMKIAGLLVFLSDVHSLGLQTAQGILNTTSWYWDLNDATRKWAARYYEKTKRMPTDVQAADYSTVTTYLKAVQAAGTLDADAVMAKLKSTPIDDFYAKGTIRADGRFVHDLYLAQIKSPSESKKPWDYLKILKTLPGDQVFTTKAESRCKLWK